MRLLDPRVFPSAPVSQDPSGGALSFSIVSSGPKILLSQVHYAGS